MELVEPGRQTKVGQLDVSPPVKQDVVGFDVSAISLSTILTVATALSISRFLSLFSFSLIPKKSKIEPKEKPLVLI